MTQRTCPPPNAAVELWRGGIPVPVDHAGGAPRRARLIPGVVA